MELVCLKRQNKAMNFSNCNIDNITNNKSIKFNKKPINVVQNAFFLLILENSLISKNYKCC